MVRENAIESNSGSAQELSEEDMENLADSMLSIDKPCSKGKHWTRCETVTLIRAIFKFSTPKGIK